MRSFFGLPVSLLTDIHCPTNTDNVTHLPSQGMDIFNLNEDSLAADHDFGTFWRKHGQAQADVEWLHVPEFEEFDEESEDTGPSIGIIGVCEDDNMIPPPVDDESALRLMAEAQQVVLGFEEMVKQLPSAAACARSFNRPVKNVP